MRHTAPNNNERDRSQSPRRVQFTVPSRSPSASRDTSGRSRSASADRSWRSSERDRSRASNRQFSQPRQSDYGRANTSSGREIDACYSCHRQGYYARERPDRVQPFRRGSGGSCQSFGLAQRYQNRGASRGFRERARQSFGGPRFSQPYHQAFSQPVGQQKQGDPPIPSHRCGGRRSHSFHDCSAASAVCYNFSRVGHLSTVCRQAQSTQSTQ